MVFKLVMRVLLLLFFLLVGSIFFLFLPLFGISIFFLFPLFLVAFIVLFFLLIFKYSKFVLKLVALVLLVYFLLLIIPFPECSSGGMKVFQQECTCLGFERVEQAIDYTQSDCIGFVTEYQCSMLNGTTGNWDKTVCS
jgi:hypothetical protein